ncbi:MAG: hypothetical protein S4CHLAM7_04770 [Chlamydiae bacterium]|nr:hypothetical protein [Chlamydiota bacterium]
MATAAGLNSRSVINVELDIELKGLESLKIPFFRVSLPTSYTTEIADSSLPSFKKKEEDGLQHLTFDLKKILESVKTSLEEKAPPYTVSLLSVLHMQDKDLRVASKLVNVNYAESAMSERSSREDLLEPGFDLTIHVEQAEKQPDPERTYTTSDDEFEYEEFCKPYLDMDN